jgi:hypothetical protein
MGKELWGSRSIGEHTERQLESMKSKKKVIVILFKETPLCMFFTIFVYFSL